MADVLHKPVHYLSAKLQNFCKEKERKVRFEESEKSTNAVAKQGMVGKSWPPADGGVLLKDKETGELLPFGEHKVQPQQDLGTVQECEEIRLKGKLKWLFEQDRMFWESNSARNSRQGSPEVDLLKGLRAANKLGDCLEKSISDISASDFMNVSSSGHLTGSTTNMVWPDRNSKVDFSKGYTTGERKVIPPAVCPEVQRSSLAPSNLNMTFMSSLDLGEEHCFTDCEGSPTNSGDSSSECGMSSSDDDFETRKIGVPSGTVKELKSRASFLKAKCAMLSKEKERAVRKWKRSCLEIDGASKMAQALRSAIETLLETGSGDAKDDYETKQDHLDGQTQALKVRMEKLRQKSSDGVRRHPENRTESNSLEGRIDWLKASEVRSFASPEVPRDTQHKVEALRARLEKLMLATNSRVTDEQEQSQTMDTQTNKQVGDFLAHKVHPHETAELKLMGWFNSLSAQLATEELPMNSIGGYEKCGGTNGRLGSREMDSVDRPFTSKQATPFASKHATPCVSKQVSPLHPMHERDRDCSGSTPSSEEAKSKVIHKIAEEVRLEAEQWFQVQELLQRVGEDMQSLQEACSTWERRAIVAESQVSCMQQGQERKERAVQVGDEKVADLQKEMLRLRETVDEVGKQLGSMNIDPSGWFEAASKFGYAFMPVNLHSPNANCTCKGICKVPNSGNSNPDVGVQQRQEGAGTAADNIQPSSSTKCIADPETVLSQEMTLGEGRRRSQLPSKQWAKEIAKAEEDEILTNTTSPGQSSKLEFVNSIIKEEVFSASSGKLQEKRGNVSQKEAVLDSGASRDLLPQSTTTRERCNNPHQDEHFSRNSSFNSTLRRSPLRDVLENIPSSKENKRPF